MRDKIYRILQKHLHRFGIYTQYYPSENAIHYHLKSKPIIIQNYELNKISNTIRASKNHAFYNSLLKRFVPLWSAKINEASFVLGGGGGESSLNCFRKVKIENIDYFEKIYFSPHDDLKRINWFDQNAYQIICKYGIVAPKLYQKYEGEAFVIVYSKFLDLNKLDDSEMEENFISLAKKLYHASLDEGFIKLDSNIPHCITDFRNHFEYKNKIVEADHRLSSYGISAQRVEKEVISSKLVLTHGDIQEKNAFKGFVLIDWDTFGLYPIGFDLAFLCSRLLASEKMKDVSSDWLVKNFRNDITSENWEDFERNFNYFLYIFLSRHFKQDYYKQLEIRLIEKLKQYDS